LTLRIATHRVGTMPKKQKDPAAVSLGSRGGKARRKALTPQERSESAHLAARARWGKPKARKKGV
jgi:hypothetical protein